MPRHTRKELLNLRAIAALAEPFSWPALRDTGLSGFSADQKLSYYRKRGLLTLVRQGRGGTVSGQATLYARTPAFTQRLAALERHFAPAAAAPPARSPAEHAYLAFRAELTLPSLPDACEPTVPNHFRRDRSATAH